MLSWEDNNSNHQNTMQAKLGYTCTHVMHFNTKNSPQVSYHSHWEIQQTSQLVHHQNSKSIFSAVTSDLLHQTYWKTKKNIIKDAHRVVHICASLTIIHQIYIPYDDIIYFKVSFNYAIRPYSGPQHIRRGRNILFIANPFHVFKQTVGVNAAYTEKYLEGMNKIPDKITAKTKLGVIINASSTYLDSETKWPVVALLRTQAE